LAENNPGDTYDSGVISQYYDGANLRYTGYFRDITDAKYKLFTNLLTEPTTTVDTTDPSFEYTDLILANLSATGNVTGTYFVGNGAALTGISTDTTKIFNANSKVEIAAVNANVNMVINNTQIANVWSGGISVVGAVAASTTITATANITGGNVLTGGLVSATGNVTSAANVTGGNVLTGGIASAAGNVTGANVNTAGVVSAGGNVQGGNLRTAGIVSATGDVYGNSFIATSNVNATLNVSATANVTGGNILTGGIVSATGNISGNYFIGNGSALTGIDATGIQNGTSNVRVVSSGGNVAIGVGGTSNIAVFSTLGANVTGWIGATGNLDAAGNVAFTGTTQNINFGTSQTTGNVTVGGTTQTGTILIGQSTNPQTINIGHGATGTGNTKTIQIGENGLAGSTTLIDIGPATATTAAGTVTFNTATVVAIANTSGTALSVAGNITGGNINTSGASGNITGANVISSTSFTATANVVGGNIITAGAISAASVSASGNVTGGNVITNGAISAGGLVSATGNVTGGNISTGGLITATGNIASTANVSGGNIIGTLVGNVTGTTVSVTGNITGGNLNAAGLSLSSNVVSQIATTANITGGNLISTGRDQAANIVVTGAITTPNWTTTGVGIRTVASTYTDSTTGAAGTAATNHVHVLAQPTIAATNSLVTTTTAATLYIAGAPANGTNMTVTNPYAVFVNAGNVGVTANIDGGNIRTGGQVSATGNITGGNISTAGIASVANNLIINSPSPQAEGGQLVLAWANISGLTGQANSTWNIDVNNTNDFRIFYQNATAGTAVPITISPTTNTVSMIGSLSVNSGSGLTAIVNGAANGVGNIGSSTTYFNTVFAKATSAQYADLAEWYEADADYPPGTVLVFGGSREVTQAVGINDVRVAGVVSTNPAHIMNSGLKAEHTAAVALTGRVPTLVVGTVNKGDMMVTAGGGRAQACAEPRMGSVIGKALQDHPGGQGTIEIVVGRL
jgi:hypothetical protein